MAQHSSATTREQTPHVTRTTRTATIMDALTQRARSVLNDTSIDPQTRAIICYGLETNDPWLAELVRRAEARERVTASERIDADERALDRFDFSRTPTTNATDSRENKVEGLAEIICRADEESAGALFVLMGTLQNSSDPRALANTVKHFAFTRCGEFNLYGMVDAQVAIVEGELLTHT